MKVTQTLLREEREELHDNVREQSEKIEELKSLVFKQADKIEEQGAKIAELETKIEMLMKQFQPKT